MGHSREHFHWLDYVIFALTLLVSCAVGVYYAVKTKKQNKEEYLLGSRQMSWFPVALSLVVSYTSGVTQLGKPAEYYQHGIQYIIGIIGTASALAVTTFTFVPLLFKLQLTSCYEYLELRFQSKAVRRLGSFTIIISQLIYAGIATYSPAIALQAVTGFPINAAMLCIGAVAMFYTMLGGIKAVVATDALQCIIMLASILSIIILGTIEVGGLKHIWEVSRENARITSFNFDPNPLVRMTFWSVAIGQFFVRLPSYAVQQASVQRYSCVATLREAQWSVMLTGPSLVFVDSCMCVVGLILFTYFSDCDPLTHPDPEQHLSSPNQLVPAFVMKVMAWPGLPGIFLAAIFSGSLSTVSSCLNAQASNTWEDFLQWKFDHLSEKYKTYILKGLVLAYGVGGIVFAFLTSALRGHLQQVATSFRDTSISPIMGIFILGTLFRRANWLGAIVGGFVGLVFPMWMSLGSYLAIDGSPPLPTSTEGCVWNGTILGGNMTTVSPLLHEPVGGLNKLYSVSFMLFPVIGTFTTVLVGLVVSAVSAPFITSVHPDDVKDEYLIFAVDGFLSRKQSKKYIFQQDALDEAELTELKT